MIELITAMLLAFISVHGIHVSVGFGTARHVPVPILCPKVDCLGGHDQER